MLVLVFDAHCNENYIHCLESPCAIFHSYISSTVIFTCIKLVTFFVLMISTGLEYQVPIFCSAANILRVHSSIMDVPSNTSTVRFSPIPNQARTCKLPMWSNASMILSALTASQFPVRNCGALIGLKDSFQVGSRKSILIEFWPMPVFSKLGPVRKAFDVTPIKIRMP